MRCLTVALCASAAAFLFGGGAFAQTNPTPQPRPMPTPMPASTRSPSTSPEPSATPSVGPLPSPQPKPPMPATPAAGTPQPAASASHQPLPDVSAPSGLSSPDASSAAYVNLLRNGERQSGVIDILRKDDEMYFILEPANFGRSYILATALASGVSSGAFAGRVYDPLIIRFKRVGKRIFWIAVNTHFKAAPGAAQAALDISTSDSVITSTPILGEDERTKNVIVSTAFLMTDFQNIGADIGRGGTPQLGLFGLPLTPVFSLDPGRSYVEKAKAFQRNDEISLNLTFAGPPDSITTAADKGGVQIKVHYSIAALPDSRGYVPRLADDRVGYFITAQKRFDDEGALSPFVRYIDRWNLAKRPIVYYLTKEIPARYHAPIRDALLTWNDAFARLGYRKVIEVREQPGDPAWDPDDIRYSTVRWITSDRPDFASYAPSIVNPLTGEILSARIVIEGETMRAVRRGYSDSVAPARRAALSDFIETQKDRSGSKQYGAPLADDPFSETCTEFDCGYAREAAAQAAIATVAIDLGAARSIGSAPAFARAYLQAIVLHEAGHNFGLRHNLQSSTVYSLAQVRDKRFTSRHGLAASVMDYTPVNLSPPKTPQGDLLQLRLGAYDYWAIRYGYEHIPGVRKPLDELPRLRQIAEQSTRPEYAYNSDEDAKGPFALDPRAAIFDLSSDPLGFAQGQFQIAEDLVARLDREYPRDDRAYYSERQAFLTVMDGYARAADVTMRYIGGVYTSRAHRGQKGAGPAFTAVPKQTQQRAFGLLEHYIFASRALVFPPPLLNDLGAERYHHWNSGPLVHRQDFPLSEFVAGMQDEVLNQIFSPATLTRILDSDLAANGAAAALSLNDVFAWTSAAVWDSLALRRAAPIKPLHRALQRRYTDMLISFALAPPYLFQRFGFPAEVQGLARYQLARLEPGISAALRLQSDAATRAHLEDVRARMRAALSASPVRGI